MKIKHGELRCRFCKKKKKHLQIHVRQKKKLMSGKIKIYIWYVCRACNTERLRAYRKTDKGKAAVKRAAAKYDAKNKEKRTAWWKRAMNTPLKKKCEDCGSRKYLHGHHEDYSKPLEVVTLCAACHKKRHL